MRDHLVVVGSPKIKKTKNNTPLPAVVRGPHEKVSAWKMKTAKGISQVAVDPILNLSSVIMVRDAVRAGAGIARLPISLVSKDIEDGRLVHWGDIDKSEISLWALYPSRRLLYARVSAFFEFLKIAFPYGTPNELAKFINE